MAKFEEYGNVPQGAYLERLNVGGQTKDAEYFADLRASDVGNNNQQYIFDCAKTGDFSGSVGWDQIPHLYSTTAQSIWNGAGTANLTTNVQLGVLAANGYGNNVGTLTSCGATYVAGNACGFTAATFIPNSYIGSGYNNTVLNNAVVPGLSSPGLANINGVPGGLFTNVGINPNGSIYATNNTIAGITPTAYTQAQTTAQAAVNLLNSKVSSNLKVTSVGIERDKFETDNKWTPSPNWEIYGGFSSDHRDGTQISGVVWGGPGGPERLDVPRPVDDTTTQAKLSVERTGEWEYGHWNVKLFGGLSDYHDDINSFTVENPFAQIVTLNTSNFCASSFISPQSPCASISLPPSNQSYTANLTSGIDLPWASRFMSTVQYQANLQNDALMPMTSSTGEAFTATANGSLTPLGATAASPTFGSAQTLAGSLRTALPETSAQGNVEVLTVNDVLSTQITPDLKSTLRYRFYDNNNQTPEKSWAWTTEDYAYSNDYRTNLGYSRSQQNASEDLTYHLLKNATIGGSIGWEEIGYGQREAAETNEFIGKIYSDVRVDDVGMFRGSYQYSERRYDEYDSALLYAQMYPLATGGPITPCLGAPGSALCTYEFGTGMEDWTMLKFDLANRNEDKAAAWFVFDNIPYVPNLTITPSTTLKFDHYLTDTSVSMTMPNGSVAYQAGVLQDNQWTAGIEASYAFKPGTTVSAAYIHEVHDMVTSGSPSSATSTDGAFGGAMSRWLSNMVENTDTVILGFKTNLNDSWTLAGSYSYAFDVENWTDTALGAVSDCTAAGSVINPAAGNCQPFPTVTTNSQRVDAVLRYHFDPELISKAGFSGDVFWNLKYSWDHLHVNNWQQEYDTPYMVLIDGSNNGRNIAMAGIIPNYDVQIVASSINFRW